MLLVSQFKGLLNDIAFTNIQFILATLVVFQNEILSLNNVHLKDSFDTDRPQLVDIIREINENVLICNSDIFPP